MNYTVYSIGLGPGDPELITLKAKKILELSDIIVVPQSNNNGRSIARDIVSNYIEPEKIYMYYFPMNNNKLELKERYNNLAQNIKSMLNDGKKVSYVTMGDPTIFSTSNYITKSLKAIDVQVKHISGISSITAASCLLGLPLSIKGGSFGIYEMPIDPDVAVELINRHESTVFMKVNKKLPYLLEAIKIANPTSAHMVRRIGLPDQAVFDLLTTQPSIESAYLSVAIIKRSKGSALDPQRDSSI
ncbi:MAG: precorrin-2 C(20)-methyltransferase [Nitrospirae bacterium]|nr:precorrin-2 C(20)-methyltransferase [Nitrospirota bacterium]